MTRASKICSTPGCPNFQPCEKHAPVPWEGSQRRDRTVSGSAQQKRAQRILRRYDRICHVCNLYGADEVDHVISLGEGGPDTEDNLRPIHSRPCHQSKTAEEAARARARR